MNLETNPSGLARGWMVLLGGAMAGGLGWGIRGQYGHETGAMIAGLLVTSVLVMLLGGHLPWAVAARAMALGTIAIGIGGSMTYGQTVGLTHDAELVGHLESLRWGMVGLAVKGGIWIGFAGLFLGLGLGGQPLRPATLLGLGVVMLGLAWIGIQLFNEPFDPARRILPRIYFSDDWRWEPFANLKPRREVWGGLLLALVGAWFWVGIIQGNVLARRLTIWAFFGGAVGFPTGQSLQSFHAWNPEAFKSGFWLRLDPFMNWWNFMETTFGFIMGGVLGLGLWFNRRSIAAPPPAKEVRFQAPVEGVLLATHLTLLLLAEFSQVGIIGDLYDFGLVLALIPLVGVVGGRLWPAALLFPITLLPIAGKTVRQLVYRDAAVSDLPGWLALGVLPVAAAIVLCVRAQRWEKDHLMAVRPAAWSLLFAVGMYSALNFAFFRFPWPWTAWTARTPNAVVFTLFAVGLAALAWRALRNPGNVPANQET
ncbi:MAG: hypothetical protein FJ404_18145 [Verrucomicrobia bacterium]|nr:hypothetical protein [Verrucomicrobiota bacterium]